MPGLTTRIESITIPVSDQDAAIAFYTQTLGLELWADLEAWPGERWVEVAPPGSAVGIALLKPGGGLPLSLRLATADADAAYAALIAAGARVHQPEVLRLKNSPPMFTFNDPFGNLLGFDQVDDRAPEVGSAEGSGAALTSRIESVAVTAGDLDAAKRFYVDVLGFELRADLDVTPGNRWVEVAPPGSEVRVVVLPSDTPFPVALRLNTRDADTAHAALAAAGATLHQPEVLRFEFAPPMFTFDDPDGNLLDFNEEPWSPS